MRISVAVLAAMAFCAPASAAPLEVYGQLPTISDVDISPDGDKIAYLRHDPHQEGVVALSLNPVKQLLGGKYPDVKLRGLSWGDDTHILVTHSVTRQPDEIIGPRSEWYLMENIYLSTGRATALLKDVPNGMNIVYGDPMPRKVKGRNVIYLEGLSWVDNVGRGTLYQVDLGTSHSEPAPQASTGKDEWVVADDGSILAESAYDESGHHWDLWLGSEGSRHLALTVDALIDTPSIEGLSPDGQSLIIRMLDGDQEVFRAIPLKGGSLSAPIAAYQPYTRLMFDPQTHRAFGGVMFGTTTQYAFFDPKDQATWNAIMARFPNEDVQIAAWARDCSRIIVEVTGQVDGVAYVLIDLKSGQAMKIGDVYKGLSPDDVAGVEAIEYKAADGTTIPAYLTLPNNKPAKALPLIVLPHSGPATMDTARFDWWAQALASRGYAVLQPQYRGSYGFAWSFYTAGFGQWGRKMQTDLSDGVRALAHAGIIDPKRVCIVGASYGGYAALAGPTLDPGVYRCAVSVSGVSDMHKMLAWQQEQVGSALNPTMRFWDRFVGAKDLHDPVLDAISPIKHLDKVNVPILLIHGKDDTVVPFEQSQIMVDALKAAGKPVQFVVLPGEDHWMSRSETRLQMLQETVKFLEANNPPG